VPRQKETHGTASRETRPTGADSHRLPFSSLSNSSKVTS
jgi:hypothetical protein